MKSCISFFKPNWIEKVDISSKVSIENRMIILCGINCATEENIYNHITEADCVLIETKYTEMEDIFEYFILEINKIVKSMYLENPLGNTLIQIVVPVSNELCILDGISGYLKTLNQEKQNFLSQLIEVDIKYLDTTNVISILEKSACNPLIPKIKFINHKLYFEQWNEYIFDEMTNEIPWKKQGVYFITGGLGKLGYAVAKEIARKVENPVIICTGSSDYNPEKEHQINELKEIGAEVFYKKIDIKDKMSMCILFNDIYRNYGNINGIIHAAGLTNDSYILKKTDSEILKVLAPKVRGVINLDIASRKHDLDFFVCYSSIAGCIGNVGQSDYAAGNAFMNEYAIYRNRLVDAGICSGKTLSIAWPFWEDGGLKIDQGTRSYLENSLGIMPMNSTDGIEALCGLIISSIGLTVVASGDKNKFSQMINNVKINNNKVEISKNNTDKPKNEEELKKNITENLKKIIGDVVGLENGIINETEPLEIYGLDSLMIKDINYKLEVILGDLSKTLFFEYQTLEEIVTYLINTHKDKCIKWVKGNKNYTLEKKDIQYKYSKEFPILKPYDMEEKSSSNIVNNTMQEPIAIVGISGRYPHAKNINEFWDNLKSGKDCINEIPEKRWSLEDFYCKDIKEAVRMGLSYSKWGGFLDKFAEFDPLFFNISPAEAINMDPQERLFLEVCWETMEDAGYTRDTLKNHLHGEVGVFVGAGKAGFELYRNDLRKARKNANIYTSFSSIANRVSYFLGLNGPSISVDTMCSASLTAINEACNALWKRECRMAFAGGVNLYLHPSNYSYLCSQNMLSPDGKCRSFGKDSNGFVPGEGVGAILLRPLSEALKAKDNIYALICSTSINHGGKTNGYTVPNPIAQGQLIQKAIEKSGFNARQVTYIEAHGTGTELGDPIEVTALTKAFSHDTNEKEFCALGSVKSNIGHLEAAAGIAGLTKAVLQLQHKMLVPSLHSEELNPNINFSNTPFYVQQRLDEWKLPIVNCDEKNKIGSRIAGVSAFGAGGSNAHIVLREYMIKESNDNLNTSERKYAFILSAKTSSALLRYANRLLDACQSRLSNSDLGNIAYTLQIGREEMEERLAFIASSFDELIEKLKEIVLSSCSSDKCYRSKILPLKERPQYYNDKEDIDNEIYEKYLERWVKGYYVDWRRINKKGNFKKISLPTYPFEEDTYWIWEDVNIKKENYCFNRINEDINDYKKLLEQELMEEVSVLLQLNLDRIDKKTNFADYGFDSISLGKLSDIICNHWQVDLTPSIFFTCPTINRLSQYILERYPDKIKNFYGESENTMPTKQVHTRVIAEKKINNINSINKKESIAIIGMSGRFPNARTVDDFWKILEEGRDVVNEIPADRFDWRDFYSQESKLEGTISAKWCGCVPGIREFDPLFFEISPKEAEIMDPRQRLLLQEAWNALENAAYGEEKLNKEKIGMFVGAEQGDYQKVVKDKDSITANHNAILASRLAYFLNLKGPVISIDTACSSGLVAVHQACLSLEARECDTAIVAGVNLLTTPEPFIKMSQAGMLSKEGKCYAFDERADGLVPGEAIAVVILKRLTDAEKAGDPIYAVIEGSGINYDGKTNGITAPNSQSQSELLNTIYKNNNINPEDIEYVIAHGTGTKLGDPLEIDALCETFKGFTNKENFCAITSTKPNIGHTFAASGIVSLINMVQAMCNELIPGSIHCEVENDYIEWEKSPFYINKSNKKWPEFVDKERKGAVSAFGMSGTNAHVVLRSYHENTIDISTPSNYLFAFSARTEENLGKKIVDMLFYLKNNNIKNNDLKSISHILLEGRTHFRFRFAFIAKDIEEAITILEQKKAKKRNINAIEGNVSLNFNPSQIVQRYVNELSEKSNDLNIDNNMQKEVYYALADFYCQGYEIKGCSTYYKISRKYKIPTYPFLQNEYWANNTEKKKIEIQKENEVSISKDILFFKENWKEKQLIKNTSRKHYKIICFLREPENRNKFLIQMNHIYNTKNIIFITPGNDYKKINEMEYIISDNEEKDFINLFQEVSDADSIFYLWSLEDEKYIKDYSIIFFITKALKKLQLKTIDFILAAKYNTPLERCYAESWSGFQYSLRNITTGINVRTILCSEKEHANIIENISNELQVKDERIILYDNKRYVNEFTPFSQNIEEHIIPPIKRNGTYLITGGCGGLGKKFAEYFAKSNKINLILIGRSKYNDNTNNQITHLEDIGANVEYIQCDLCDFTNLNTHLKNIRKKYGPITGVIHAAGVSSSKTIFEKELTEFEGGLSAKIEGSITLSKLLKDDCPDFICFFSSSSAYLGDFGACDYSIGNRFEVAYSKYLREENFNSLVISWPLWREGGMGFQDREKTKMYLKSSGQSLLESQEGLNIFSYLTLANAPECLVLSGKKNRINGFLHINEQNISDSTLPLRLEADMNKAGNIEEMLERDFKNIISILLNIKTEDLDIEQNLTDFGFDSINLSIFAKKIEKYLRVEVSPSIFFNYTTIQKLVEYFMENNREALRCFYERNEDTKPEVIIPATTNIHIIEDDNKNSFDFSDEIAIIGMSGRFPDAKNVDELWEILSCNKSVIRQIDMNPLELGDDKSMTTASHAKYCGCIPGKKEFDPYFFEIPPKDAEIMDPRQRILLEEAWLALEDAGYTTEKFNSETIGVFVGVEDGDYSKIVGKKGGITSNHTAIIAARISYFMNLVGPNMAINSACSSGLVALHQACMSLRNGECDTALVASANLMFTPESFELLESAGILSPDGKCYAFDQRANGTVPAEAAVVLVLKKIDAARAANDSIYAAIQGSGVNYDGKTNGITAPNGLSQEKLYKYVYDKYNVDVNEIGYVIAHGTGTKLGDPVEINSLIDTYKQYTNRENFCALSSVKANLGHSFAASGLVSLVSMIMAMRNETIPGNLNFDKGNDFINWSNSPFYISKSNREWKHHKDRELVGAVSAFGMGGTNAHVVLRSYQAQEQNIMTELPYYLLVISSKSEDALKIKVKEMILYLEGMRDSDLTNICYSAHCRRCHFRYRYAIVAKNIKEAIDNLKSFEISERLGSEFYGVVPRDFKEKQEIKKYLQSMLDKSFWNRNEPAHYQKILIEIADYYCQGYAIGAESLYIDLSVSKVNIPTYPFINDEYWFEEGNNSTQKSQEGCDFDEEYYSELIDSYIKDDLNQKYTYILDSCEE